MTLLVEKVSVRLGRSIVLKALSFEAKRGELIMIVGPNGAGKTTLLKAIAGLIHHEGAISWEGQPMSDPASAGGARRLAYLPQGHVAHWPIKARDVVTLGRAPFASSMTHLPAADSAAIDDAIEAVGAAPFADRPVTELSGGERARVMLARALAVGAPLLLADEPVASLDPAHQLGVMTILENEARQGRLVVAVSHDLLLAARFASRVLVLSDGGKVALATPAETLTPAILKDVFSVNTMRLTAGEMSLEVPWTSSEAG